MHQALSFLAWHYTTGARFLQMLKQRAIQPCAVAGTSTNASTSTSTGTGTSATGKPVIWFSVNDDFEPSACPAADVGQGLVRLGVPVRTLLTCSELRQRASIPAEAWDAICEEGRSVGSDPDQWFGCMRAVPLDTCVVEVRDDDGTWRRLQMPGGRPAQTAPPAADRQPA